MFFMVGERGKVQAKITTDMKAKTERDVQYENVGSRLKNEDTN